jgi:hypothetical protein
MIHTDHLQNVRHSFQSGIYKKTSLTLLFDATNDIQEVTFVATMFYVLNSRKSLSNIHRPWQREDDVLESSRYFRRF